MGKTLAAQPRGRVKGGGTGSGKRGGKKGGDWRRIAKIVGGVMLLALVLRIFVVHPFRVPSRSMEDTLLAGDCILVDKLTYGALLPILEWRMPALRPPRVGELLVFKYPVDPARSYVKRCLAVAGQMVEIRDKVVYIDGARQPDPPFSKYVDARIFASGIAPRDNYGPREVPVGSVFVAGDNRDNSRDSRHWGFLPLHMLEGRALLAYWSVIPLAEDERAGLGNWWTFLSRVRWHRLGTWGQ